MENINNCEQFTNLETKLKKQKKKCAHHHTTPYIHTTLDRPQQDQLYFQYTGDIPILVNGFRSTSAKRQHSNNNLKQNSTFQPFLSRSTRQTGINQQVFNCMYISFSISIITSAHDTHTHTSTHLKNKYTHHTHMQTKNKHHLNLYAQNNYRTKCQIKSPVRIILPTYLSNTHTHILRLQFFEAEIILLVSKILILYAAAQIDQSHTIL